MVSHEGQGKKYAKLCDRVKEMSDETKDNFRGLLIFDQDYPGTLCMNDIINVYLLQVWSRFQHGQEFDKKTISYWELEPVVNLE